MKRVGLFLFAWELVDGGDERIFKWAAASGINQIYLTSCYHAGYFLQTHNQQARVYMVEDGAVYFRPDWNLYGSTRLKPRVSKLCNVEDLFERAATTAEKAGLQLSAWTVCLHNTYLGRRFPGCAIQNVFGDPYFHALTPAHPEVRAYVSAMVKDLGRFPLQSILLEAPDYRRRAHGADWVSGHHHERTGVHLRSLEETLMSLSFNPRDWEAAQEFGVDISHLADCARRHLSEYFEAAPDVPPRLPSTEAQFVDQCPEMEKYQQYQKTQVESFISELKTVSAERGCQLEGGSSRSLDTRMIGVYGLSPEEISKTVKQAKQELTEQQQLVVALRLGFDRPGSKDYAIRSQEEMVQCIQAANEGKPAGIAFYNYTEAPWRSLNWIRPSLKESGVSL